MINTLLTIGASFLLAMLSALTFLAYKHPHAYKKLTLPSTIVRGAITAYLLAFAFYYGFTTSYEKLKPYISEENSEIARNLFITFSENTKYGITFFTVSWLLLYLYFLLLSALPWLLKKEKEHSDDQ